MTFHAERGHAHSPTDRPVRLRLKPAGAGPGGVNGAWWPRSRDTLAELPALVDALRDTFGAVSLIALGSEAWAPGPHRLAVDDNVIAVSRFHRQHPHTIMVLGVDRSQTTLLVIPPEAPEHLGEAALRMAGDGHNTASPTQILADSWLASDRSSG
jgi:hypothetical protein